MRSYPNARIILHWLISLLLILLMIINWAVEPFFFSIFTGILLLVLLFNRTSYVKIDPSQICISKKFLLFIPAQSKSIPIDEIKKVEINTASHPGYFGDGDDAIGIIIMIFFFVLGYIFYMPSYKLSIIRNHSVEHFYLNISFISMDRLKDYLKDLNIEVLSVQNV